MPKNLRQPARVKNKKKPSQKIVEDSIRRNWGWSWNSQVQLHNLRLFDHSRKKRKKCEKTCTKNIKVGVRGSREREGGKNSLILWA